MAKPFWDINIRILSAAHRKKANWHYERVPSSYFHLYWHETPGAIVQSGDLQVYPEPSVAVLITPYTAFAEKCEKNFTQNYIFFNTDFPYDTLIPKIHVFKLTETERAEFRKLSTLLQKNSPHPSEYILIHQLICNILNRLRPADFFTDCKLSPEIAIVKKYIDVNYTQNPSSHFLAKKIGMSVRTLARKYTMELGQSLHSYLLFRRIQVARQLLKDSTKSIDELSNELGFTDRYHFSKTFRRFLQMTPSQFRREIVSACKVF